MDTKQIKWKCSIEKVLFLDIDGVLNKAEYGIDLYEDTYADYCLALHRPSVEALKKLVYGDPELQIVWISDWAKTEDKKMCNRDNCIIDPLLALSRFNWLNRRVLGSIFTGQWTKASGNEKILAIKDFVEKHLVESYAIVDDDIYTTEGDIKDMSSHFVHIDPLKAFLEDDISLVERALSIPMDASTIHKVLRSLDQNVSFSVNKRYHCQFDSSQANQKRSSLFIEWQEDPNCPRLTSEASVSVYDEKSNERLVGKVVLAIHKDLNNRHNAILCLKHLESSNWETTTTIIQLSDIKRSIELQDTKKDNI